MHSNVVIITRHPALVAFLKDYLDPTLEVEVISHATPELIRGRDVYGVLPLNLACLARSVTTVDMDVPADRRGTELSLSDIRKFYRGMSTYTITKLEEA